MYRSLFTPDALQGIKQLPKNVKNALKKEFQRKVHVDPIGCSEPLAGLLSGFRSFHFGNYRIVYKVFQDIQTVSVVGVGKKDKNHFTNLYKKLEILAQKGKLAEALLETYRSISP